MTVKELMNKLHPEVNIKVVLEDLNQYIIGKPEAITKLYGDREMHDWFVSDYEIYI